MDHKRIWFQALGATALLVSVGLPPSVEGIGYEGCAEDCNGAYCWGENQHTKKLCFDGLPIEPWCAIYPAPVYCS